MLTKRGVVEVRITVGLDSVVVEGIRLGVSDRRRERWSWS